MRDPETVLQKWGAWQRLGCGSGIAPGFEMLYADEIKKHGIEPCNDFEGLTIDGAILRLKRVNTAEARIDYDILMAYYCDKKGVRGAAESVGISKTRVEKGLVSIRGFIAGVLSMIDVRFSWEI